MRYGFILFIVTIALPLAASTRLYDRLASPPSPQPLYATAPFENSGLEREKDELLDALDHYRMSAMLRQQFVLYNADLDKDYVAKDINVNQAMSGEARALTEDTIYTQVMLLSAIGVLVVMPQSISNWDLEELQKKSLGDRWIEHVTTKPVWDQDDWAINYIGHPVSGAAYYTMARNDGFDIFESALFSTVMSSFFWEYGYESFAEVPSIQDLIFTPLLGSFLGEGMHILEGKLDENEGVVWGSKALGSFSYFWLSPLGSMTKGMSDLFDIHVTMEFANFTHANDTSQFRYSNDQALAVRFNDRDYGVLLTFY